ncbi:MAG TPA: amidohydrolase family protein [Sphingobium sp.]|uniref:amidohydrolase family protein n=1 Tax=Sphingobium sp. TaxID=1912891 RepID=UPI002ED6BD89
MADIMLIRHAEIYGHTELSDLRLSEGRVVEIGALTPLPGEQVIDAKGGALLPGLHDHHIHLPALAARRSSVFCGPPEVTDTDALAVRLSAPGTGWLRGIGYHESVAGMLDRATLDRMAPHRPVRIQHRSGRMWFFNTAGLDAVLAHAAPPPGLDHDTGQLFDEDRWLREALGGTPPDLGTVSAELARMGLTGITDMSPANDAVMAAHFRSQQAAGRLRQRCLMAGVLALAAETPTDRLAIGPAKLHLHEADLPDYDGAVAFIATAHAQARVVAIHCVSETELVFALAALEEAGMRRGDRIEHASVAPDHLVAEMARLGLIVVSQPHFIAERGDDYRVAVEADAVPWLYRLQAFRRAGVVLAGGSDAPFGEPDPWAAMRAAVERRTRTGHVMGAEEALSPEEALGLFLADPVDLGRQRTVAVGVAGDLCLLDRPWREARERLSAEDVRAAFMDGVQAAGS